MAIPVFVAGTPLTAAQLNALVADYVPSVGGVLLTDAAQTIVTATVTDITWGTEVSDPDGWVSGGSATLTVPAGQGRRYIVSYWGGWSAAPGTTAGITCITTGGYSYDTGGISVFATFSHTLTLVRTFAAGNTLTFRCYHTAGSDRNITSRLEICPA